MNFECPFEIEGPSTFFSKNDWSYRGGIMFPRLMNDRSNMKFWIVNNNCEHTLRYLRIINHVFFFKTSKDEKKRWKKRRQILINSLVYDTAVNVSASIHIEGSPVSHIANSHSVNFRCRKNPFNRTVLIVRVYIKKKTAHASTLGDSPGLSGLISTTTTLRLTLSTRKHVCISSIIKIGNVHRLE